MALVNSELSREILAAVDKMQAFPESVQNILRLTSETSCAPKDLVEVIVKDPVVTVKVLRVVNSAYYSLPRKISSIEYAVVFLGFNTIKNLALSIAAIGMVPRNPLAEFDSRGYLLHSLVTAGIARQLAPRFADFPDSPDADANDFFLAGLLHDFGNVVVAQAMPDQFKKAFAFSAGNGISLQAALQQSAGLDPFEIGAILLEKWQFPSGLAQAIRQQSRMEPGVVSSAMAYGVALANRISCKLGYNFGEAVPDDHLPAMLQSALGSTLTQVMASIGDLDAILQESRRFTRN